MRAVDARDFGAIVRQARLDANLSQSELAERIGMTRQWLSRLERGTGDPSLAAALRTTRELDIKVSLVGERSPSGEHIGANLAVGASMNPEVLAWAKRAMADLMPDLSAQVRALSAAVAPDTTAFMRGLAAPTTVDILALQQSHIPESSDTQLLPPRAASPAVMEGEQP